LVGLATEDLQVNLSHEAGEIFKYFVVRNDFGVIAAAIQRDVDREDYISQLILLPLCASACENSLARCVVHPIAVANRKNRQPRRILFRESWGLDGRSPIPTRSKKRAGATAHAPQSQP